MPINFRKYGVEPNNLIKNIAQEVVNDCLKLDVTVEPNVALLAVHVHALTLDPEHGLLEGAFVQRKAIDCLIRKCIAIFSGALTIHRYVMVFRVTGRSLNGCSLQIMVIVLGLPVHYL